MSYTRSPYDLCIIQRDFRIHENNLAGAEGIEEEKIAEFEAGYDDIVRTATRILKGKFNQAIMPFLYPVKSTYLLYYILNMQ